VSYVDLSLQPIDPRAVSLLSEVVARKYQALAYKFDQEKDELYVATSDPTNTDMAEFVSRKTGKKLILQYAYEPDVVRSIELAYAQGSLTPEVKEALKEYQPHAVETERTDTESVIKEAPIAKIVSTILEFAVKNRASDIHVEPEETRTRIRYRIDGILQEKLALPPTIHEALISRIKILSQLKIDERRIPQDGRFSFDLAQQEVDLRVSTLPTVFGEKVVMRLLKKTGGIPTLAELGVRGIQYQLLQSAITKPHGIVLVTGPTGSGKTTTLYSLLSQLNKTSVNISTLEDPVEYQIPGINQVQINPQAGLTFASGLRAFLRQDPNIILVGEIRDKETTQLAIQAALTGHLVFSTLHTNDSATAIPRLIDLGAEPFLIATVINGVLAQRISRRICEHCRESYMPDEAIQENIRQVLGPLLPAKYKGQQIPLYRGRGCEECTGSGYRGRMGIYEFLVITPSITSMIVSEVNAKDIEEKGKSEGLILMKQDGYLKVLDGFTTIEEVLRVAET
jgi:type IV pilus assembly protein PilB